MALVKVKFTGAVDRVGVRLDDDVLDLDGNGEASDNLETGPHFLTYFMIGPPGTLCKIALSTPGVDWEKTSKIPSNGVNGGFKKFVITGGNQ